MRREYAEANSVPGPDSRTARAASRRGVNRNERPPSMNERAPDAY